MGSAHAAGRAFGVDVVSQIKEAATLFAVGRTSIGLPREFHPIHGTRPRPGQFAGREKMEEAVALFA